jgi:hypothetical protein
MVLIPMLMLETGVPDVWDPPARVLQLRPSRNKPKLPEMIDCE